MPWVRWYRQIAVDQVFLGTKLRPLYMSLSPRWRGQVPSACVPTVRSLGVVTFMSDVLDAGSASHAPRIKRTINRICSFSRAVCCAWVSVTAAVTNGSGGGGASVWTLGWRAHGARIPRVWGSTDRSRVGINR